MNGVSDSARGAAASYYVAEGDQQRGPFDLDVLSDGRLRPDTLVWRQGMADWQRAADVEELRRFLQTPELIAAATARARANPSPVPLPQPAAHAPAGRQAPAYAAPSNLTPVGYPHQSSLTDAQRIMYFQASMKSCAVAYLLWFFFGMFGAHRFYLNRAGSAVAILLLTLVSIPLSLVLIGILTIWIPAVWCFVDLFLIPGMTESYNQSLAAHMR